MAIGFAADVIITDVIIWTMLALQVSVPHQGLDTIL